MSDTDVDDSQLPAPGASAMIPAVDDHQGWQAYWEGQYLLS